MAKSISLSFDMNELYLNDEGGKVETFPLGGDGADVSLDNGALKVELSSNQSPGSDGVMRSKSNNQWTLEYDENNNQLFFIGVTDTLGTRTPEVTTFNLNNGAVNIRLNGNSILVTT